jgi:hypothetical protein
VLGGRGMWGVGYKVDANGRDVGFGVRVICKSEEEARLADSTVSYKEESARTGQPPVLAGKQGE